MEIPYENKKYTKKFSRYNLKLHTAIRNKNK